MFISRKDHEYGRVPFCSQLHEALRNGQRRNSIFPGEQARVLKRRQDPFALEANRCIASNRRETFTARPAFRVLEVRVRHSEGRLRFPGLSGQG